MEEEYREGTCVRAWGKDLYVKEVRERGYWLTESMSTRVGWFACHYDIDYVIE